MSISATIMIGCALFLGGVLIGAVIFNGPDEPESKYWTDYIKKD